MSSNEESKEWCKIVNTEDHGDILIQKFEDDGLGIRITIQCDICEYSQEFKLKDDVGKVKQHIEFLSITDNVNNESIRVIKSQAGLS